MVELAAKTCRGIWVPHLLPASLGGFTMAQVVGSLSNHVGDVHGVISSHFRPCGNLGSDMSSSSVSCLAFQIKSFKVIKKQVSGCRP